MKQFTTTNGDNHKIDDSGNHFIGIKCVNPKCSEGGEIGDTYPNEEDIVKVN